MVGCVRRLFLPVCAAVALAACDASTTITKVDIAPNYRPLELGRYAGGDNALRVVSYGSPFGDLPARVADALVAAMQGHTGGPRITFSADPAPPPKPRWRVVMALNPTGLRDTIELCKLTEPPQTARSADTQVRIMAAFCQGDFAATQATARGKDITSLNGPKFDALIAQLTHTLFPGYNPHDNRSPCLIFPCRI